MKTFYLIDGHAQLFRAYYAPFRPLTSPAGEPVKAVHVFGQMLLSILQKEQPDYLAVAWDVGDDSTHRKAWYPPYKEHRDASPEDLHPQFLRVRQILEALEVPSYELRGYEADDLIATIAKQLAGSDVELRIVSKDKDLYQILTDTVKLWDPSNGQLIDPAWIVENKGFGPEQSVEVQTLTGDSTDNVPGAKGVGTKTAAKLVGKYGSVEAIYEHLDELTPKLRENLEAHKETLPLTRRLVTLDADVDFPFAIEECSARPPSREALKPLFDELGFRTLLEQVNAADTDEATGAGKRGGGVAGGGKGDDHLAGGLAGSGKSGGKSGGTGAKGGTGGSGSEANGANKTDGSGAAIGGAADAGGAAGGAGVVDPDGVTSGVPVSTPEGVPMPVAPERLDYRVLTQLAELDAFLVELRKQPAFAIDTETTSLRGVDADIVGYAFSWKAGQGWYLPVRNSLGPVLDPDAVQAALKPILEDASALKVGQNLKYDLTVLERAGIRLAEPHFDTMIAASLLYPARRAYGMDDLARDLLGHTTTPITELIGKGKQQLSMRDVPLEQLGHYAAEDGDVTWRLYERLNAELAVSAPELQALFRDVEMPLVRVLSDMERAGVTLDGDQLERYGQRLAERIETLRREAHALAGREFNLDSPKQLGELLFDDLGFRVVKKTKTSRSTDAEVLDTLASETDHPLLRLLLEYRELTKLLGTYLLPLPSLISPSTGRLHASFHQTGAATGRLSSSDPNIQNIPVRTEAGREIRRAFTAPSGEWLLLSADYSQVELRMLAHFSEDPALLEAFKGGHDIHAFVASQIFSVPLEEVDAQQRRVAKTVNFGIVYGQTAYGLARTLHIPTGDASAFIEAYKERYQGLERFLQACIAQAEEHGYVATILGRRRPIPEIASRNRNLRSLGERLAINTVVQGSAADLIKLAMIRLNDRFRREDLGARLLIQVHDELVIETPRDHAEQIRHEVVEEMTTALPLNVPLRVDASLGANWLEGKAG